MKITTQELYDLDRQYGNIVAGVDEAGRGPLAGPVAVACCIPGKDIIDGVNDSKKLSEKKREHLYEEIIRSCLDYTVAIADENVIDDINILQATKICMEKCANNLAIMPDIVLIDAVKGLKIPYKSVSLIKADEKSYAVAAASIIAKVTRDRIMREYDAKYPFYGFASNKGYGSAAHIRAIAEHGPCPIHRRTFIRNFTDGQA